MTEFDPGILAGHAKSALATRYPKYLEVQHKRADLGGFCRAPPAFQPASLFTAGFMLEDVSGFELDETLHYWPSSLDHQRLSVLMLARAFVGLAFFERLRITGQLDETGTDLRRRYLDVTQRVMTDFLEWSLPDSVASQANVSKNSSGS